MTIQVGFDNAVRLNRSRLSGACANPGGDLQHIVFVLLPEFPLYALTPALEALRLANQNSSTRLYEWQLLSVEGSQVVAGNGMRICVNGRISDVDFAPLVFVCAGNHPLEYMPRVLLSWLRRLDRHGAILGAIDTGAFALAEAGLLNGSKVVVHWEALPMFRDRYPGVESSELIYAFEENRITCAGGNATLDMMLSLIQHQHGTGIAQMVANSFIHSRMRVSSETQRPVVQSLAGGSGADFARIVYIMEQHVADPLSATELAEKAGISRRVLNRIVRQSVGISPMRYYLRVRLSLARNALFYGDGSVSDIAYMYGFSCPEVFSRDFKAFFGMSPSSFRKSFSREQLKRFMPELSSDLRLG